MREATVEAGNMNPIKVSFAINTYCIDIMTFVIVIDQCQSIPDVCMRDCLTHPLSWNVRFHEQHLHQLYCVSVFKAIIKCSLPNQHNQRQVVLRISTYQSTFAGKSSLGCGIGIRHLTGDLEMFGWHSSWSSPSTKLHVKVSATVYKAYLSQLLRMDTMKD